MKEETLAALNGSIQKWEKIVNGIGVNEGRGNCPLCQLFPDCYGCPVAQITNSYGCNNSPYGDWSDHQYKFHNSGEREKVICDTCKELAINELNFIKSLLP